MLVVVFVVIGCLVLFGVAGCVELAARGLVAAGCVLGVVAALVVIAVGGAWGIGWAVSVDAASLRGVWLAVCLGWGVFRVTECAARRAREGQGANCAQVVISQS